MLTFQQGIIYSKHMNDEIKKEETAAENISLENIDAKDESLDPKKRKSDFYIELALFFILGILLGLAIKTESVKKITMGFDDYKMNIMRQDYKINQIQKDLAQKNAEAMQKEQEIIENQE